VDDNDGLGGRVGAELACFAGWELGAGSATYRAFHTRRIKKGGGLKCGFEDGVEGEKERGEERNTVRDNGKYEYLSKCAEEKERV